MNTFVCEATAKVKAALFSVEKPFSLENEAIFRVLLPQYTVLFPKNITQQLCAAAKSSHVCQCFIYVFNKEFLQLYGKRRKTKRPLIDRTNPAKLP